MAEASLTFAPEQPYSENTDPVSRKSQGSLCTVEVFTLPLFLQSSHISCPRPASVHTVLAQDLSSCLSQFQWLPPQPHPWPQVPGLPFSLLLLLAVLNLWGVNLPFLRCHLRLLRHTDIYNSKIHGRKMTVMKYQEK